MQRVSTTDFFTHCCKKPLGERRMARWVLLWAMAWLWLLAWPVNVQAQSPANEVVDLGLEQADDGLYLNAALQLALPALAEDGIPFLRDVPLAGPALFAHDPLVYGAMALAVALIWFLDRTRTGLVLRAVGESPQSAHALGYPVRRIRLLAAMAVFGALELLFFSSNLTKLGEGGWMPMALGAGIFLMLTTTYSRFAGLEINLPTADANSQAEQPNEVSVAVTASGQILVDKSPLAANDVHSISEALRRA